VLYRGVELSESALESYRDGVGRLFTWSVFASFTAKRDEAEEYGRAWRSSRSVQAAFSVVSAAAGRDLSSSPVRGVAGGGGGG
jgi:hypothetical protein